MNTSTRFAVATHLLTLMAMQDKPISSAQLAKSVNSSAAVVRQLLMRLSEMDLVTSRMGPGGGSLLARPAQEISLFDVWQATEAEQALFCTHRKGPNDACSVGRHILEALGEVSCRARAAFFEPLKATSVADMVASVASKQQGCSQASA